jgi:hypothetical protein
VIAGGVYSRTELNAAVMAEKLVREHYADVHTERVVVKAFGHPAMLYASFRKGGAIYWTRKPVRVPAGEQFLTDGVVSIRARCGNRLSKVPRSPVTPTPDGEPGESELEKPVGGDGPDGEGTPSTGTAASVSESVPVADAGVTNALLPLLAASGGDIGAIAAGPTAGDSRGAAAGSPSGGFAGLPVPDRAAEDHIKAPFPGREIAVPPAPLHVAPPAWIGRGITMPSIPVPAAGAAPAPQVSNNPPAGFPPKTILPGADTTPTNPLADETPATPPRPPVTPPLIPLADQNPDTPAAVATPEPGAMALVLAGGGLMLLLRLKRGR